MKTPRLELIRTLLLFDFIVLDFLRVKNPLLNIVAVKIMTTEFVQQNSHSNA